MGEIRIAPQPFRSAKGIFPRLSPSFESNAMKKVVAILVLVACTASFAKKILVEDGSAPVKTSKKK
jgi:hypothetical protein